MIVNCPECIKKFIVQDQMIPAKGRHLQCGKCNHVWFFQLEDMTIKSEKISDNKTDNLKNKTEVPNDIIESKNNFYDNKKIQPNRSMIVTKNYPSKKISFLKVFLLLIITFIAIIILLDLLFLKLLVVFDCLKCLNFHFFLF